MKIVQDTQELGRLARHQRRSMGLGLRAAAPLAHVGTRFLSEFERGKPTVELGKALGVLQATGLDLAVVRRKSSALKAQAYSQLVGTEFPYDWSNSQMHETTFIIKVLQAGRFNDTLKTVAYFGMDTVGKALPHLDKQWATNKVIPLLLRIQEGCLLAQQ